jgi:hypothetical protein
MRCRTGSRAKLSQLVAAMLRDTDHLGGVVAFRNVDQKAVTSFIG